MIRWATPTRVLVSSLQVALGAPTVRHLAVVSAAVRRRARTGSANLAAETHGTTITRAAVEVGEVSAVGSVKTKDKATQGDLEGVASVAAGAVVVLGAAAEEEGVEASAAKVCRSFNSHAVL